MRPRGLGIIGPATSAHRAPRASAREPAFAKATARSRQSASRGGGSVSGSPRGEGPSGKTGSDQSVWQTNREMWLMPCGFPLPFALGVGNTDPFVTFTWSQ